jgi:hypothetical protein
MLGLRLLLKDLRGRAPLRRGSLALRAGGVRLADRDRESERGDMERLGVRDLAAEGDLVYLADLGVLAGLADLVRLRVGVGERERERVLVRPLTGEGDLDGIACARCS